MTLFKFNLCFFKDFMETCVGFNYYDDIDNYKSGNDYNLFIIK